MNLDMWYTEKQDDGLGISLKVNDILYSEKSEFQQIDILNTYFYGKVLYLDGLLMTTEKDEFIYHEMISHIPLLSHPEPKQILIIGGGDGGTVREVLKYPSVKRVVLCEIDGKVIEACKKHLPSIAGRLDDPKVDIQVRDGVTYIADHKNSFDVILIDSTDPLGPGEGLFTEEFYTNVKQALKPNGIMVAQSESPISNQREIKLIYGILNKVFSNVHTYVAPIPTYPAGFWSWCFCSKATKPLEYINEELQAKIEKETKYYNKEIHNSAFALPNFVKQLVE